VGKGQLVKLVLSLAVFAAVVYVTLYLGNKVGLKTPGA
jgi:hypothetical protein